MSYRFPHTATRAITSAREKKTKNVGPITYVYLFKCRHRGSTVVLDILTSS